MLSGGYGKKKTNISAARPNWQRLSPTLQELAGYAMGQYALGYYTPPGGPGEGPEVVPPQYALGAREALSTMGGTGDLEALNKALGK